MPSSEATDNGVDLDALSLDALDRLDGGVIGLDAAGAVVVFSEGDRSARAGSWPR